MLIYKSVGVSVLCSVFLCCVRCVGVVFSVGVSVVCSERRCVGVMSVSYVVRRHGHYIVRRESNVRREAYILTNSIF